MGDWIAVQYARRTPSERAALLARAKAGDSAARSEFLEANMPLAVKEGQRAAALNERITEVDDAIQEAAIGLVKALDWYDPKRVNPETGKAYQFSTLAVNIMRDRLQTYFRRASRISPQELPETPVYDKVHSEVANRVANAVCHLYPSGRDIIVRRYWLDMSFAEIGREKGCSGERIRQLHEKAIEQLRSVPLPSESQSL